MLTLTIELTCGNEDEIGLKEVVAMRLESLGAVTIIDSKKWSPFEVLEAEQLAMARNERRSK